MIRSAMVGATVKTVDMEDGGYGVKKDARGPNNKTENAHATTEGFERTGCLLSLFFCSNRRGTRFKVLFG